MIKIHDKAVRGRTQMGWLDSHHTFSFGGFNDPTRMGFGHLRVINEDRILSGSGFAPHDHEDMDILTLVLNGTLRHEDDQGNIATIGAGELQAMSAGRGVRHSELNASDTEGAHFLQIWLIPEGRGGTPSYAQAQVPETGDVLLAGPAGAEGLVSLGSRVRVHLKRFDEGDVLPLEATPKAHRFVHLLDGLAYADTERVSAGDGLQIPAGESTALRWQTSGEALLFDMPLARTAAHVSN